MNVLRVVMKTSLEDIVDAASGLLELSSITFAPPPLGAVVAPNEEVLRYHLMPRSPMDWKNAFVLISDKVEELGWHCCTAEFIDDKGILTVVVVKVEPRALLGRHLVKCPKVRGNQLHKG